MNRAKQLLFALVVILSGTVYFVTLCPTVEMIDSGELAMAAKNLGVAHPTGYPLYTLLGRIFAILPIGSLIFRVNLLSLLFTAFASGFLYLLISEIITERSSTFLEEGISAAAALFVAFSPVWWDQGTTNEVYSLNLLLISISIWSLIRFTKQESIRWLILSLYMLGLSMANHLSAVYLIPGFLYLIIITLRREKTNRSSIIYAAAGFVFPASLYAILPIRASFKPFLNWGGVSDPYFFYKHITGWQYRVWMFSKPWEIFDKFGAKISPAWKLFIGQFGWIGIILIIVGIVISVRQSRKVLIFGALIGIINLIYVLNYDIVDIESYYLPMFLVSAIFLAMGIVCLAGLAADSTSKIKANAIIPGVICVSMILPIYNLLTNFHEQNKSGKTAARQGVYDYGASMETGGLALVENWDFYSPWLYLRFAENYRPDLVLIDKELMRRPWYIDFIKRNFNDVYERSKPEFEEFRGYVELFERDKSYDAVAIDKAYYDMLHAVINNESKLRPVYTNALDDSKFLAGFNPIPCGILFRFSTANTFMESPRIAFDSAYWIKQSDYEPRRLAYLLSTYYRAFQSRSKYCEYYGKQDEAAYYKTVGEQAFSIAKRWPKP
ncbi:MAG TPA: hypothetical protein DCZ43_12225 [candidate division Zixibacteria bacterium]|nr:hypothetical protein [candidate division Zixibacteria bacterium]